MKMVVATSGHAYRIWLMENELDPRHYIYAGRPEALAGWSGEVIMLPRWTLGKSWETCHRFARAVWASERRRSAKMEGMRRGSA